MPINIYRTDYSSYLPDDFAIKEKKALEELTEVKCLDRPPPTPSVLITTSYTRLDELQNVDWEQIKLIIHPNSGYDNFSASFVKNATFPIVIGNQLRAQAVASYILSAIFQHFAQIPFSAEWNHKRIWDRSLISEKKVLLIGYGHIGKIVYHSLQGITEKIEIVDPFQQIDTSLTTVDLSTIDILIISASLNPTSRNLVNKQILKQFSPHITIINTARGEIINENDLLTFLKSNPNASAYLDVFAKEPYPIHKYTALPNLHTSSHLAGVYSNLPSTTIDFEKSTLRDFIELSGDAWEEKYRYLLLKNRLHGDFLI